MAERPQINYNSINEFVNTVATIQEIISDASKNGKDYCEFLKDMTATKNELFGELSQNIKICDLVLDYIKKNYASSLSDFKKAENFSTLVYFNGADTESQILGHIFNMYSKKYIDYIPSMNKEVGFFLQSFGEKIINGFDFEKSLDYYLAKDIFKVLLAILEREKANMSQREQDLVSDIQRELVFCIPEVLDEYIANGLKVETEPYLISGVLKNIHKVSKSQESMQIEKVIKSYLLGEISILLKLAYMDNLDKYLKIRCFNIVALLRALLVVSPNEFQEIIFLNIKSAQETLRASLGNYKDNYIYQLLDSIAEKNKEDVSIPQIISFARLR